MSDDLLIWAARDVPDACALDKLTGVDRQYELAKGIPRASTFPQDAAFTMDSDFFNDLMLTDNLINTDRLIVASRRLKEFLEARPLRHVEYLPVTIIDHKGKPASREYFIVHPTDLVDCLDMDQSEVEWGLVDEQSIDSVARLVIDLAKVDPAVELFRPKPFYDVVVVRRALAEAIDAAGFVGIRWIALADYPEL
jgi:hypothetical protein